MVTDALPHPRVWVPLCERFDRSLDAWRSQRWFEHEPDYAFIVVQPLRLLAPGDVLFERHPNGQGCRWSATGWSSKFRAKVENVFLQYARFTPTEEDREDHRAWEKAHPRRHHPDDPPWLTREWIMPGLQCHNRSPARLVPRPDAPSGSKLWSDPDVRRLALSALRAAYSARPVSTNSGAYALFAMAHDPTESRWFITPSAMDDYRRVTGRDIDDDQVLAELGPVTLRAHLSRTYPNGRELWRGKALTKRRLRLIVGPPQPPRRTAAALVAVLPHYDGAEP